MAKEKIIVAGGGLVGATAAAIFADEGHWNLKSYINLRIQ